MFGIGNKSDDEHSVGRQDKKKDNLEDNEDSEEGQ